MNQKLQDIYTFLLNNRKYNFDLQTRYYESILLPYDDCKEKLVVLLYNIANTQSQPNIDKLASFYKMINEDLNCLESFESFVNLLNPNKEPTYYNLFKGLEKQNGWGGKTAALFVKTIYHIHNGKYNQRLKIWDDVPQSIDSNDLLFLPVDTVIITIFNKVNNVANSSFSNINKLLQNNYSFEQIEVWDDLWFWGFISQNGTGIVRNFEWNENKYWILKESDKNPNLIFEIKNKVDEFLSILNN